MSLPITLYYTASLDGFITDGQKNTPWSETSWAAYLSFCTQMRNLIMGRKTYELFISDPTTSGLAFENLIVVSGQGAPVRSGFALAASPTEATFKLESRGATHALLIGGAHVASSFLAAGLISEVRIDIEPIILGTGTKMFLPQAFMTRLQLLSSDCDCHGRVTLQYKT